MTFIYIAVCLICTATALTIIMADDHESGFSCFWAIIGGISYICFVLSVRENLTTDVFQYLLLGSLFFIWLVLTCYIGYRRAERERLEFSNFSKISHK